MDVVDQVDLFVLCAKIFGGGTVFGICLTIAGLMLYIKFSEKE